MNSHVGSTPHNASSVEHWNCGLVIPAQSKNCGGYRYTSILQQHYPTRKRRPRTPQSAPMPHDVSRDNADSPEDDQQRRSRRQKMSQPQMIPMGDNGCTDKI